MGKAKIFVLGGGGPWNSKEGNSVNISISTEERSGTAPRCGGSQVPDSNNNVATYSLG